jgi:hypothetical protein
MGDDGQRRTPVVPANIDEFNKAAGLIFTQLYPRLPERIDIDQPAIAKAFGIDDRSWASHTLPSGLTLGALLSRTMEWLVMERYIASFGSSPGHGVLLTEKGLRALNAVQPGFSETVGTELKKAVERGSWPDLGRIGDLIGGIIGGLTKSMSS